eukprot:3073925-Prymnesium_polylepis.2
MPEENSNVRMRGSSATWPPAAALGLMCERSVDSSCASWSASTCHIRVRARAILGRCYVPS